MKRAFDSLSFNSGQWPHDASIVAKELNGSLITELHGSEIDLSDALMRWQAKRAVILEIQFLEFNQKAWTKEYIQKIQGQIFYDLNFDGYSVDSTIISKAGTSAREPLIFQLNIGFVDVSLASTPMRAT